MSRRFSIEELERVRDTLPDEPFGFAAFRVASAMEYGSRWRAAGLRAALVREGMVKVVGRPQLRNPTARRRVYCQYRAVK